GVVLERLARRRRDQGAVPLAAVRQQRLEDGGRRARLPRAAVGTVDAGPGGGLLRRREDVLDGDAERVGDRVEGADRRLTLAGLDLGDQARRDAEVASQAAHRDAAPEPLL